ncbi:unnamed protein product [Discosporangium mesarthrocarpum]
MDDDRDFPESEKRGVETMRWKDSDREERLQQEACGGNEGGGWDTSSEEGGGNGFTSYEQRAAAQTRKSLLENGEILCREETAAVTIKGEEEVDPGMSRSSARYIPGDPFAREHADVGSWARHFTYLSILPSASFQGRLGGENGLGIGEGGEDLPGVEAIDTSGGTVGSPSIVEDEKDITDPVVIGRTLPLVSGPEGGCTHESEDEILASHGILEEYIAYDHSPPGEQYRKRGGATWPRSGDDSGGGDGKGLNSPQRELREQVMDRLFDELWGQLTPDLSRAAVSLGGGSGSQVGGGSS